jgi:RNA-directed DNA polymerase
LCETREGAEAALEEARVLLEGMGLSLSPEKSRIAQLDEGFDFVGWHYKGHQRWPRQKSVKGLRLKLRERTQRLRPGSMEAICSELTPTLRGWFTYFRNGNSGAEFARLSGWVRRRLRSILHRRHHGKGIGGRQLHLRWPNQCFNRWGLFDLEEHLQSYRRLHHALSP